jgi:Na+-transporting NADH:ubiquinone oxidoreductase subunit NqrF
MVVVIDHHAAHVYQDVDAKTPESEKTVKPHDPWGFHHHLIHKKEAHYVGERVPEEKSFYEEIAEELKPAAEIVLIGHGTGTSSAMDHLLEFLKKEHSEIAQRVKATETADLSALTAPEIEAIAKKHMIAVVA